MVQIRNSLLVGYIILISIFLQSVKSQTWSGNTLYDLQGNGASFTTSASSWTASSLVNSGVKVYTCAGIDLLGGYNILGSGTGQYFERTYSTLPAHNQIAMNFTFNALDNWVSGDGDHFEVLIGTVTVVSYTLYHSSPYSTNRCGSSGVEIPAIVTYVKVPHTDTTSVKVRVTQKLQNNKASTETSMGFRDLSLTFETVDTPATSICGKGGSTILNSLYCPCELTSQYMSPPQSGTCYNCDSACATCTGSASNQCTGCPDSRYLSGNTCNSCHASCATCNGPLYCLTCSPDMFMVDQSCTQYCPLPLYSTLTGVNNVCKTPCPGQYAYKDGTCSDSCASPYSSVLTVSLETCVCYNLVQDGADCYACDSSCATCKGQAAEQCLTCYERAYLVISDTTENTGTCEDCDPSCLTCNGPTASECLTCDPGTFLATTNSVNGACQGCDSSCVTCNGALANQCLTCDSNYFYTADPAMTGSGTCALCDSSCATCSGSSATNCLTCHAGFFLVGNNTCIAACNSPFIQSSDGVQNFCDTPCPYSPNSFAFESGNCKSGCDTLYRSEITTPLLKACYCDHYEYWNSSCLVTCNYPLTNTRTQGTRKFCDFPCTSNEYLYFNASCRASCFFPYVPSVVANNLYCGNIGCETMNIKFVKSTADGYQYTLKFTKDTCDFEAEYIQVLLNSNDAVKSVLVDFSFTVTRTQAAFYLINLELGQSVKADATIKLQYSNLASALTVYQKTMPSAFAKQLVAAAESAQAAVLAASAATLATTLATQGTASVWGFVGFQQLINFFKYINVQYPFQVEMLFALGGGTNFNKMPNVIDTATKNQYNQLESDDTLSDQQAPPYKFINYQESSIFIKNGASIVVMNLCILIAISLIALLRKIPKVQQNTIFEKVDNALRWNFLIRTFLTGSIPLGVAICLQLRTLSFDNSYLSGSSVLTIIGVLYFMSMCAALVRIVYTRPPEEFKKGEFQNRYGTLVKGVDVKTYHAKYYYLLVLLRGIVISIVIVFVGGVPLLQIICIMFVSMVIVYLLFKKIKFEDPRETRKTQITEALLIPEQILIACLTSKNKSDNFYNGIGWLAIGLIGLIFINELVFVVCLQLDAVKKVLKKIEDKPEKKNLAKVHDAKVDLSVAKFAGGTGELAHLSASEEQRSPGDQSHPIIQKLPSIACLDTPSADKLLPFPSSQNLRPSTAAANGDSKKYFTLSTRHRSILPSTALADGDNKEELFTLSGRHRSIRSSAALTESNKKLFTQSSVNGNLRLHIKAGRDIETILAPVITEEEMTQP